MPSHTVEQLLNELVPKVHEYRKAKIDKNLRTTMLDDIISRLCDLNSRSTRMISSFWLKAKKRPVLGRPLRYLSVLFRLLSLIKRIEKMEAKAQRLEDELSMVRKQWFSGDANG